MDVQRFYSKCMNCTTEISFDKWNMKDGMNCPSCRGPIRTVGSKTVNTYADGEPIKEPPLLTIELENETSVPKVFYKGEEITGKRNVFLDWDTDTDEVGGLSYALEYVETAGITKIERRVKGHGFD